jgi:hypothetical protein
MSNTQQFIVFCLEIYKAATGLTGKEALDDFEKYDVFSYLTEGFEVLHTQGQAYLVADIQNYIANRR